MDRELHTLSSPYTPGQILAAARIQQNVCLADMSGRLRLSVWQVTALENDEYDRLAGPTFIRGIIRGYAKALGIDPQSALDAYQRVSPDVARVAINVPSQNIRFYPASSIKPSTTSKIGFVAVVCSVVFVIWYFAAGTEGLMRRAPWTDRQTRPVGASEEVQRALQGTRNIANAQQFLTSRVQASAQQQSSAGLRSDRNLPSAPFGAGGVAAANETSGASSEDVQRAGWSARSHAATYSEVSSLVTAKPAPNTGTAELGATPSETKALSLLRLTFSDKCWVEVRDNSGAIIFKQLNPAGSEQVVNGRPPFKLIIGNAAAATVTYNDAPIDLKPHTRVRVARFTLP
jgi:cytoskeleton protein RodZ